MSSFTRNVLFQGIQSKVSNMSKEVGGFLKGLHKVGTKALNKVLDHPTLVRNFPMN